MISGQKITPAAFRERLAVPGVWKTDLDDPSQADVLVVAALEPEPAEENVTRFLELLKGRGISVVLFDAAELCMETQNHPGATEALRQFLRLKPPQAMVIFGEKAVRGVARNISAELPAPPLPGAGLAEKDFNGCRVIPLMSLAPPAWNRWKRWAWMYLDGVVADIAGKLVDRDMGRAA
ncbi:hypothetical protein CLV78_10643 [Aliiruegeria haliotis]|uniref:Uncharacterized protein n=1 Tax=Aliiruegeria haliotis TaxID=1280846 RepID=A0A2T0RN18_9RHOB|nr:hypothetical protein [Aliiruegeria haliotis]PRY22503.1 hypothetical protein CLV78_10643 [Aliiruegeria haliotis]